MKRYPAYKDSGVDWLGKIPEHWGVKPLKYITRFINGAAFKPDDWASEGIPIIRIENLNGGQEFNYSKKEIDARYHVCKGDILFGWSGNRGTSFGPFLWDKDGLYYLNQHIFRLQGFSCDKNWFYWTLKGVTFHIETQAHGIIGLVHIKKGELGAIKVPQIPKSEQQNIVHFIAHKFKEIDQFINNKQRLIQLLKEQKTTLISQIVTKGINPRVPLKDSGIEWLGEIPAHWVTERAKFLFGESRLPVRDNDGIVTAFRDGQVTLRTNRRSDGFMVALQEVGYQGVRRGQLVIHSMDAFAGAVGVSESDGKCTPEYIVCKERRPGIVPEYYAFCLRQMARQRFIEVYCPAVRERAPRIRYSSFGEMWLPVPPNEEQMSIVASIGKESSRIEDTISKAQREIELIQEYRTTLIYDVVTGKIDVRQTGEISGIEPTPTALGVDL